jgi:hypothetical protein
MRLFAILLSLLLGSLTFAMAQGAPTGRGSTTGDPAASSANPRAEPGGTTGTNASNPSGSGTSTSGGKNAREQYGCYADGSAVVKTEIATSRQPRSAP